MSAFDEALLTAQALGDLRTDLADLAENPLTYTRETHGELHADALKTIDALLAREEAERARVKWMRGGFERLVGHSDPYVQHVAKASLAGGASEEPA